METIKNIIKSPVVKRTSVVITDKTNQDEIDKWAVAMHGNNIVPIFQISSVTGVGLP